MAIKPLDVSLNLDTAPFVEALNRLNVLIEKLPGEVKRFLNDLEDKKELFSLSEAKSNSTKKITLILNPSAKFNDMLNSIESK